MTRQRVYALGKRRDGGSEIQANVLCKVFCVQTPANHAADERTQWWVSASFFTISRLESVLR